MRILLFLFMFSGIYFQGFCYAQPFSPPGIMTTEEDGDPNTRCLKYKFANGNVTKNGDGTCSIADQSGAGGGDPILIDTVAVTDASGVDIQGGAGVAITFNAAVSPDTAIIATASSEVAFLASGALTCGAGTAGKMQIHTTPLQYCDNAATPALQYAAYGSSTGVATSTTSDSTWTSHNSYPAACAASNWMTTIGDTVTCSQPAFTDISGAVTDAQVPNTITVDLATTATTANAGDSATSFFSSGTLEVAIGGTGTTTSTGTGAVVLGTSPTFTTGLTIPVGGLTDAAVVEDDLAASLAFDDGDYLNLGAISITTTTEGLTFPGHATDCSLTGTTEGQVCWEADANVLYIGNGATVTAITGGSGAPTTVDYLVGTADGTLSAEIVVGTAPGGELGGTWGTPTIDDSISIDSPTFTTAITATNLIVDAHLATTESINLPVYSAKLTGAFVVFTPPTADACTAGAQIDAGDGNWRLLFDATTDECAMFQYVLPDYWAAHSELKIFYTMTSATANEVDFEAAVMCVTPTDAADVGTAGFANVATASDTVPGTVGYLDSVSVTITDDSCAGGDIMFVVISKDANDATLDDATGDTEVVGVVYEFTR